MDINDVRGIGSIFAIIAFSSVIWWAYGSSRKDRFEGDSQIPFEDNEEMPNKDVNNKSE